MAEEYLDKVYKTEGADAQRALYDEWAGAYDADLSNAGYATPGRLARALAGVIPDKAAPVLDFGCGTGLSGEALAAEGFTTLDGCDPSDGMLDVARGKGVYRNLWTITEGEPLDVAPGAYAAIAAVGVISKGAAPPAIFDVIAPLVAPGQILAVSYNSHTLDDPDYMAAIDGLSAQGFETLQAEDGPHVPAKGLTSRVYLLRRA